MRLNGLKTLGCRQVRRVRQVFPVSSVGRVQGLPELRVLEYVLPQSVIMTCAHSAESPVAETQV
jgi:hypothetical protein